MWCITNSTFSHDCHYPREGREYWISLNPGNTVRVQSASDSHLRVEIGQRFRIVASEQERLSWTVLVTRYEFSISDDDEKEIVAYHFHPGEQAFEGSHLHILSGAGTIRPDLRAAHLPTGPIAAQDFILMAIRDFNVRPLRSDYLRVLAG